MVWFCSFPSFPGSLCTWTCALCFHCPALLNYYILKMRWRKKKNSWLDRSEWAWRFLSLQPRPVAQSDHCFMNKSRRFDILPLFFFSKSREKHVEWSRTTNSVWLSPHWVMGGCFHSLLPCRDLFNNDLTELLPGIFNPLPLLEFLYVPWTKQKEK